MIRPAQDARFGDYQANCAMPLSKQLGKPSRVVAEQIVERVDVADLCEPPEVAGPGFINLRLRADWLARQAQQAVADERLNIARIERPRTIVLDYSSPNVAKPMHVGHIRSTVIGQALDRTLRFIGHKVISDNHLGDWGTQFGMIIFGYKHFLDREQYAQQPVEELGRLYKLVNQLVDYHALRARYDELAERARRLAADVERLRHEPPTGDKAQHKKLAKQREQLQRKAKEAQEELASAEKKIAAVEQDPVKAELARAHPDIGARVLDETARLHAGDPENRRLWEEFMPKCREELHRTYRRLGIEFDYELGESFYHDRLAGVVEQLQQRGLAVESNGAICVFLDGFETPMIVRKSDGAYLYATTDLATIEYRMETWKPDAMLYVVDSRQSEHFAKLFATARLWGYSDVEFQHISFGTVLGEDGKPYRTREGEAVSLDDLLDEAVRRAYAVVCQVDDGKKGGRELSDEQRRHVAEVVGLGAIKYRDLSHNRTSDYVFSFDKMLELDGNTSAYLQYAYARVQNIFSRGNIDPETLRGQDAAIRLEQPEERALALATLRFHEALEDVVAEYRPNHLTSYLYDLAGTFSRFYTQCKVLEAESPELRASRLRLCDLTGRTIRTGLELLGIDVVDKM